MLRPLLTLCLTLAMVLMGVTTFSAQTAKPAAGPTVIMQTSKGAMKSRPCRATHPNRSSGS